MFHSKIIRFTFNYQWYLLLYSAFCILFKEIYTDKLPTCQADNFKYDFTECDSYGGRWRVSVPISPGHCIGGAPNPPVRVNKCFTSCEGGQFFNMSTLLCEDCDPGHYSLGGGMIIDSFNSSTGELPNGFHIVTESTKHTNELNKKCIGWYVDPITKHLVSSMKNLDNMSDFGSGCVSAITYTAKVVKSGYLRFTYHYRISDDVSSSLLFTFHYRLYDDNNILNEGENSNIKFPLTTVEQKYETVEVQLKTPGLYIFTWKSVLIGNFRNFFSTTRNSGSLDGKLGYINRNEDYSFQGSSQANIFKNSISSSGIIRIKKVTIEGVAYASECTPCEPGTYAPESGMRECLPCPANYAYEGFGATKCSSCDNKTEYSSRGSIHCQKRPICGVNDFYSIPKGKCDPLSGKQELEFKWIEPRICVDVHNVIPSTNEWMNCTESTDINVECDLGMELKHEGISEFCQFCPNTYYRDQKARDCQPCPPFTSPFYALSIFLWNNSLPAWSNSHNQFSALSLNEEYFSDNPAYLNAYFSRQCIRTDDDYGLDSDTINRNQQKSETYSSTDNDNNMKLDECDPRVSWQSFHDFIRTGVSAILDSYLVLSITIPGFRSTSGGELSFVFESHCEHGDRCIFLFVETKNDESDLQLQELSGKEQGDFISAKKKFMSLSQQTMSTVIKEWEQSTDGRLSFRYKIDRNISVTYSWVFKRSTSFQSYAKIHSMLLTDSLIGAAIKCKNCPVLSESTPNCITCPDGNYLEIFEDISLTQAIQQAAKSIASSNYRCKRCPNNQFLNTSLSLPLGVKSCLNCGPNLITDNNTSTCFSNCLVSFGEDAYDLRELQQPLLYKGVNLFTAGGTQYVHLFKITLCGNRKHEPLSTCLNNITGFGEESSVSSGIRSFICRSTIIPDGSHTFSTQSVSLGDELIGISRENTYQNITVHQDFIQQSKALNSHQDYHLYFFTKTATNACPHGRRLTITMRCSPEVEKTNLGKAKVSTPNSCPDGTCDGCDFHLLIETGTAAACRVCRPFSNDYEVVVGECIDGVQQVHYLNPKGCVIKRQHLDGGQANFVQTRPCSVLLPRQVQICIAIAIALGILLLLLVFYFWNKNRSLEYKYTKLIESAVEGKGDDDLTLDNCCAEEEEEEELDNNKTVSSHNLMFGNDLNKNRVLIKDNSKSKRSNNRFERRNASKQYEGTSKEMQQLFAKNTSSSSDANKHTIDDEGYETIHLTSANSVDEPNQIV